MSLYNLLLYFLYFSLGAIEKGAHLEYNGKITVYYKEDGFMRQALKDYLDALHGKRVALVGIGISNTPLLRLLRRAGIDVTACDQKEAAALGSFAEELRAEGVTLQLGATYLEDLTQEIIVRSPGIRPDIPAFEAARARGALVTSEMELFFQLCPCPIFAVTGSDGKTTTTTLIAELLRAAGHRVHLGGNIGKPLLAEVGEMLESDFVVLELSSFQLMTLRESPDVALVTNLSPNHLDWHLSMQEYRQAKEQLFLHQSPDQLAIFNLDNKETCDMSKRALGETAFFSRSTKPNRGAFVENDWICWVDEAGERKLFPRDAILLPGEHNVENYLAAITAVYGLVPVPLMEQTARSFPGVEHRIELTRTLNGVRYYNDSIASSPSRTTAGLHAFTEKLILIAGGYDKKIPFDDLGEEICKHVKTLLLSGHTAEKIRAAVEAAPSYKAGSPSIHMAESFDAAVLLAHAAAQPGDVVILSPACASFDQFPNFAHRGNRFKELIADLP